MAWVTGYQHRALRATATALVAVLIGIVTLWQYPGAELILFHAVWIGFALTTLRASTNRVSAGVLVAFVVGLAIIVAFDDVRTHYQELDTFVELLLDVPALLALVVMARRQRQFLAAERDAAVGDQQRNARQRSFFSNASHAMRTPITIARGHTELALQATHDPEIKADLGVVLQELDRLTRATERILRLSIAGEVDPRRLHPVDVHELVRTSVDRWTPTARRAWSAETSGPVCQTLADPEQLTEALDALIDNAVLATIADGSITVRCEVNSNLIVLSVSDDGCGVDGIDPERLFEPFEQGPRRMPHAPGGTGLGLAVVRAIAIAHGGDVEMETTPGAGSTVRMILPRSNGKPLRQSSGDQKPSSHDPSAHRV